MCVFFFQAEDGIRDLVRSRGLGDVYKRQAEDRRAHGDVEADLRPCHDGAPRRHDEDRQGPRPVSYTHLTLPTSDLV